MNDNVIDVIAPESTEKVGLLEKVTNIIKANSLISELRADNARLVRELVESKNAFDNLQGMSQGEAELVLKHNEAVKTLTEEHNKTISSLQEQLQKANTSSDEKAIMKLASAGVPLDEVPAVTLPPHDIAADLTKLTGQARVDFFAKNKAEILKLVGITPESWDAAHN